MRLKNWLENKGMSVADFAARIGVTEQAVYAWMRGDRRPGHANIYVIRGVTDGDVTANDFY